SSGFPTNKLCFAGFFPLKQHARMQMLEEISASKITYVFYESPRRIVSALELITQLHPCIDVMIAKELTKTHENYIGGNASEIIDWLNADVNRQKGEFVMILRNATVSNSHDIPPDAMALLTTLANELPKKTAAKVVAEHYKLNKKALYEALI
ncbi:MAG: rRNA (cytidine-2'-O-)-methyltransferase, partial [Pseudomonadota bacterium]